MSGLLMKPSKWEKAVVVGGVSRLFLFSSSGSRQGKLDDTPQSVLRRVLWGVFN